MPSSLIHLTSVEQLVTDSRLSPEIASEMKTEMGATKLGAIFVDLPNYAHLLRRLFRRALPFMREESAVLEPWTLKLQTHRPTYLGFAFAEIAQTDLNYSRAIWPEAFVFGYFAHLAFDRIMNSVNDRLIEDLFKNDPRLGSTPDEMIRKAQFVQMLYFQRECYGQNLLGTRSIQKLGRISEYGTGVLSSQVLQFVQRGLIKAFGNAPHINEVKGWVKGFGRYTQLMQIPLSGFMNLKKSSKVERLKHAFYRNDFFDYMDYYKKALELASDYVNVIFTYMRNGDFSDLGREEYMEMLPELDILHPPDESAFFYPFPESPADIRFREDEPKVLPFVDPRKK